MNDPSAPSTPDQEASQPDSTSDSDSTPDPGSTPDTDSTPDAGAASVSATATTPEDSDEASESESSEAPWSQGKRLGFRFLFTWFTLEVFPFPIFYIPGSGVVTGPMIKGWTWLVTWVGAELLGLPEVVSRQTGSGDSLFSWINLLTVVLVALVATLCWTVLDHRRPHYRRLARCLLIGVRYYLAFVVISYGCSKLFKTQFPFPSFRRLLTPYGDSSPMGLVWTFMGFSLPYNLFTGLGEAVGGLLLLWRRTTTLGALILVGVMSNVVMLNFAYDVPVKIFSTQLLILALILAALDSRRLLAVLVLNRPAPAVEEPPYFDSKRWRIARLTAKVVLIGWVLFQVVDSRVEQRKEWGDNRPKPPLYGLYDVETFLVDGEERPPLTTDAERWQNLLIEYEGRASVRGMDGTYSYYTWMVDEESGTATLATREDEDTTYLWHWEQPESDQLTLSGELEGQQLEVRMRRRDLDDFLLVNRGFHWVSEFPFNR